jgi:hypothetical protein
MHLDSCEVWEYGSKVAVCKASHSTVLWGQASAVTYAYSCSYQPLHCLSLFEVTCQPHNMPSCGHWHGVTLCSQVACVAVAQSRQHVCGTCCLLEMNVN